MNGIIFRKSGFHVDEEKEKRHENLLGKNLLSAFADSTKRALTSGIVEMFTRVSIALKAIWQLQLVMVFKSGPDIPSRDIRGW